MRLCPSVEGSPSPLITHRIGAEVCMARQRTFFHKCHRCIYRGQPASWEPEEPLIAMIPDHAADAPSAPAEVAAEVKAVEVRGQEPPRVAAQEGRTARKAAAGKNGSHAPKPSPKRNGVAAHAARNGAARTAAGRNGAAEASG